MTNDGTNDCEEGGGTTGKFNHPLEELWVDGKAVVEVPGETGLGILENRRSEIERGEGGP